MYVGVYVSLYNGLTVVEEVVPDMLLCRRLFSPIIGRFKESVSLVGLEVVTSSSLGHSVVALIG